MMVIFKKENDKEKDLNVLPLATMRKMAILVVASGDNLSMDLSQMIEIWPDSAVIHPDLIFSYRLARRMLKLSDSPNKLVPRPYIESAQKDLISHRFCPICLEDYQDEEIITTILAVATHFTQNAL
jgi:hypothetical protein